MVEEEHYEEGGVPFYPYHLIKEVALAYLLFGVLLAIIALFPPRMEGKADPTTTPQHIKPEWYFLGNYQFLKLFPPKMPVLSEIPGVRSVLGEGRAFSIIIQGLVMLALFLVPFLDRSPHRHPLKRPFFLIAGVLAVLALIGLSFWGKYS